MNLYCFMRYFERYLLLMILLIMNISFYSFNQDYHEYIRFNHDSIVFLPEYIFFILKLIQFYHEPCLFW